MALTNKQQAFIEEYLKSFNATRAAEKAGYSGDDNTLAATGSRLLRNNKISAAIELRLHERAMSADEVLMRLAEQGRATLDDFVDVWDDGVTAGFKLNLVKAAKRGKLHLVKSLKYNQWKQPEIELHDAQKALQLMGKHHKLFADKVVHTWEDEVLELLRQGKVTPEDIKAELGEDLARQLFVQAGVNITVSDE